MSAREELSNPSCLCIPLNCENGKTTAVKTHSVKIMKIINFSVTTVANWMVYFYYMESRCYKLKLFIFNASERRGENTFISYSFIRNNPRFYSVFDSPWLKDEFCFYYVDFYLASRAKEQRRKVHLAFISSNSSR